MLRIAIVGTGWWGMELGKAAKGVPGSVELAGCYSRSEKECAAFQSAYGGKVFSSYEEILADPKIDAVLLATPHSTHSEQIVQAAKARKHVFCEKPFTLTVESGQKAMDACEKAGVVLAVGHNRRYLPGARRMKEMVDAGDLGKVLHIEAGYAGNGAFSRPPTHWRSKREEMPCGGLAPMALHVVDTFTWILGPVAKVACLSKRQVSPVDIDDTCASLFELENGATGFLSSLMAGPMASRLRLCGSKGALEARSNWSEVTFTPLDAAQPEVRLAFTGDDTLQQEMVALDAAVSGKAPYPVKPQEALRNVAVMETMLKSSLAGGAWMQVPQVR
jgi:predicted dehydrogenase